MAPGGEGLKLQRLERAGCSSTAASRVPQAGRSSLAASERLLTALDAKGASSVLTHKLPEKPAGLLAAMTGALFVVPVPLLTCIP